MQKLYTATAHNVIQLLRNENIDFPISKKDLLAKTGKSMVKVDFDKAITFEEYCKGIKIDNFENKSQFFCALIGSNLSL